MINRREFVKFGAIASIAPGLVLTRTTKAGVDPRWENFSRDLKSVEDRLIRYVISGKASLKEISNLGIVQFECFSSRLWQFSIGSRSEFFARPLWEVYIIDGEVVDYDFIADALKLPLKYHLEMQLKAVA